MSTYEDLITDLRWRDSLTPHKGVFGLAADALEDTMLQEAGLRDDIENLERERDDALAEVKRQNEILDDHVELAERCRELETRGVIDRNGLIEAIADYQACGSCAGESWCAACQGEADAVIAYLAAQREVAS